MMNANDVNRDDISEEKKSLSNDLSISDIEVLLNNSETAYILINGDLTIQAFNRKANQNSLIVYGKELQVGKSMIDFTIQGTEEDFQKDFYSCLQGRTIRVDFGTPSDNPVFWFDFRYNPVINSSGNIDKVLFSVNDITERKIAEIKLKESEERFKALHNASFGGIAIHDKGIILECNKGLSEITGYSQSELHGMDGLLLIAPQTRDYVMDKIVSHYEKPYEALGIKKDKTVYPLRLEAREIPYMGKTVRAVEFRDITEEKEKEAEIKKALKVKEALLRELYHRTKNNMGVISAILLINSERTDDLQTKNVLREINNKIEVMALVHQKLYQAQDLTNIELDKYIRDLTELIVSSYGKLSNDITVNYNLSDVQMSIDYAIPLGLIIAELISNTLKHAFPENNNGVIDISLRNQDNNDLIFTYSDNGIGLEKSINPKFNGSMGFTSIYAIAEGQLNGEVSVNTNMGLSWTIKLKNLSSTERVYNE